MRKPKPPKTFKEVKDYIEGKKYNVNPQAFWDYFEATEWYDKYGEPVLSWKGRVVTWHYRDKRTVQARKVEVDDQRYRQKIRDEYQPFLEDHDTRALLDLKRDGGQLAGLCGWLIDEILAKRN